MPAPGGGRRTSPTHSGPGCNGATIGGEIDSRELGREGAGFARMTVAAPHGFIAEALRRLRNAVGVL